MKLKAKAGPSKITKLMDFEGVPGWKGLEIDVRYISPSRRQELVEVATVRGKYDHDRFLGEYAKEAIAAIRGLKPEVFWSMIEEDRWPDDVEKPQPNGDGTIHLTPDEVAFLFLEAPTHLFQDPIYNSSRSLIALAAEEKKVDSASS